MDTEYSSAVAQIHPAAVSDQTCINVMPILNYIDEAQHLFCDLCRITTNTSDILCRLSFGCHRTTKPKKDRRLRAQATLKSSDELRMSFSLNLTQPKRKLSLMAGAEKQLSPVLILNAAH